MGWICTMEYFLYVKEKKKFIGKWDGTWSQDSKQGNWYLGDKNYLCSLFGFLTPNI